MSMSLSPNTQAILLLTAPLIAGRDEPSSDLLTPSEYKRLARFLREKQRQPADLLAPDARELLGECQQLVDSERLKGLLARGFLLSQAIERWQTRAIWVTSRADAEYPRRLKTCLKSDAPPVLYACGDIAILDTGGWLSSALGMWTMRRLNTPRALVGLPPKRGTPSFPGVRVASIRRPCVAHWNAAAKWWGS